MTDLENQWAWSQVEAMADRSLSAADAKRMRAAMVRDPELGKAVRRAVSLRRELASLGSAPPPRGFRRRLLRIPEDASAARSEPARADRARSDHARAGPARSDHARAEPARSRGVPWRALPATFRVTAVTAVALAAAAAVSFALLHRGPAPASPEAALENFQVAMAYLQRSTAIAGAEVSSAVGGGLRDALAISRKAVREKEQQRKSGG